MGVLGGIIKLANARFEFDHLVFENCRIGQFTITVRFVDSEGDLKKTSGSGEFFIVGALISATVVERSLTLLFLASGEKRVSLDRPHRIVIFYLYTGGHRFGLCGRRLRPDREGQWLAKTPRDCRLSSALVSFDPHRDCKRND